MPNDIESELKEKIHRLQTNIAPWWLRFIFALLVVSVTGTFITLTACGVLTFELATWLDLASLAIFMAAWCSTVWAAFWYTRTLR
jgi:hypothetical protein